MPDVTLAVSAVEPTPLDYTIPGAAELIIKALTAEYDGTNAGGAFVPCVQIIAAGSVVAGTFPLGQQLAAGASADVTWFPGVAPTPASPSGGGLQWGVNVDPNGVGLQLIEPGGSSGFFFLNDSSGSFTIQDSGGGGLYLTGTGGGGIHVTDDGGGGIALLENTSGGITITDNSSSGGMLQLKNNAQGGVLIEDNSSGNTGLAIAENAGGGITITNASSDHTGTKIIDTSGGGLTLQATASGYMYLAGGYGGTNGIPSGDPHELGAIYEVGNALYISAG